MKIVISIQKETKIKPLPSDAQIKKFIKAAILSDLDTEITVRMVDETESRYFNFNYRHKDKSTNVLAFPYEEENYLGDLILCAPIIEKEAKEQHKSNIAHWAHLLVHGTLHLQGHDHIIEAERKKMESLEIKILKDLSFANPYEEEVNESC